MRFTPFLELLSSKWLLFGEQVKSEPCPHCRKKGQLKNHGPLRGCSLTKATQSVRGLRFFCSDRYSNDGCGRTFTVFINNYIPYLTVRATQLSSFFRDLLSARNVHRAWSRSSLPFSIRSAYRWANRLKENQSDLRALAYLAKPDTSVESLPTLTATIHYLSHRFASENCFISALQQHAQRPVFYSSSS